MSDDVMTKTDMVVASYDSSYFTYESVDSALKETNENEYFRVPQGVEASSAFIYYRKVSGKAVEVAEIIGGQYGPSMKTVAAAQRCSICLTPHVLQKENMSIL
ncbi:hypothetical protein ACOMQ0_003432 [Enterobacter quasiroggenkampii]